MEQLRFMILNYSKEVREVTISSKSAGIPVKRCALDRPADKPDVDFHNVPAGEEYTLEADPGTIYGFVVARDGTLTVHNPDKKFVVLTAAGKNPWPVPPAVAPTLYADDEQFSTRFASFNTVSGGGPSPPSTIQYVVGAPETSKVRDPRAEDKTSKS